jgi:hypothetical protein
MRPLTKSWWIGKNQALDLDLYTYGSRFGLGLEFDWQTEGEHAPEIGVQLTIAFFILEIRCYHVERVFSKN